jgi:hypothetical protein
MGWSYPSRKPLQPLFSKFSTSLKQIRIRFLLGLSEVPTWVRTPDMGITPDTQAGFFRLPGSLDTRKSRLESELPTTEHLSGGKLLHPYSKLDVPYMFFFTISTRGTQWWNPFHLLITSQNKQFWLSTKRLFDCFRSPPNTQSQTRPNYSGSQKSVSQLTRWKTSTIQREARREPQPMNDYLLTMTSFPVEKRNMILYPW